MCRLVAYLGDAIPLENVVVKPAHSLLVQSQDAHEAKLAVNGDGFGIAWYDGPGEPGLYKDVFPAWSDANLPSLCRMVKSPLFIAHVRAATHGEVSRSNCHPFVYGNWAFAHNGVIGNHVALRRRLEAGLADRFYAARSGTTDSELMFLLLLNNGLQSDPTGAISRTLAEIHQQGKACRRVAPARMTCLLANGATIFAFRFATDGRSPSLYQSNEDGSPGTLVASEPLCGDPQRWTEIEPDRLVAISAQGTVESPLAMPDCRNDAA